MNNTYKNKRKVNIKVFNSIVITFSVICVMALLFIVGTSVYITKSHPLEYKEPNRYMELNYTVNWEDYSREEVKNDLEELFGAKNYIYEEADLVPMGYYGLTMPMARTVQIDANIPIEEYALTLAHEFVHLTQFTASERYCNLIAFKKLYNTEKYRDIAVRYAIKDRDGGVSTDYSCWEYIYDYLQENNQCEKR